MEKVNRMEQWLEAATSGIRFKPDREAVREELRGHFEDKAADLQRFYHISPEEAEEMALERMGNAEKIGVELSKIHKPWLGYLLRASQLALALSVALFLFGGGWHGSRTPSSAPPERPERPTFSTQEVLTLGQYEFRVEEAYWEEDVEWGEGLGNLTVIWKITSAVPWEPIGGLPHYFWSAEDDQGNQYVSYADWFYGTGQWPKVSGGHPEPDGLGQLAEQTIPMVPENIRWMRLTFDNSEIAGSVLIKEEVAAQ